MPSNPHSARRGPSVVTATVTGLLSAVLVFAGCDGRSDLAYIGGTPTASEQPDEAPARWSPFLNGQVGYGRVRLFQLTSWQYESLLRELVSDEVRLVGVHNTARSDDFLNNADGLDVDEPYYSALEEQVSAAVVLHGAALEKKLGCAITGMSEACLSSFLREFASVALRVPEPDLSTWLALYQKLRTQLSEREAFQGVITAILLSPKALFRSELGPAESTDAVVQLTPAELAEALSFTLWNGPPDAELRARAADGTLVRPEVLTAQVDRMLASPRGQAGLSEMLLQWAGLSGFEAVEKDSVLFPQFDSQLKSAMLDESRTFIASVLDDDASLTSLLTRRSDVNGGPLQTHYGALTSDREVRRGLFTHASVISAMSDASTNGTIFRGKRLLQKLLCMELVRPPDVNVPEPTGDPMLLPTARDRLTPLESMPACASCHQTMHPMAFPMENFDPIGRFRAEENGRVIDASGELSFTERTRGRYSHAGELFDLLGQSDEVHACFVRQAFRYVHGRLETPEDEPTLHAAFQTFGTDGTNIRQLVRTLVLSKSFSSRARP